MRVWLTLDPNTSRVALSEIEPDEGFFPRGKNGRDWSVREAEVAEDTWAALLSGSLPPEEQDVLHRTLWTEAGSTAWPSP